jgi:hypothetical protein
MVRRERWVSVWTMTLPLARCNTVATLRIDPLDLAEADPVEVAETGISRGEAQGTAG